MMFLDSDAECSGHCCRVRSVMPKRKGAGLLSQITGLFAGSLPACGKDDLPPVKVMIADVVLILTKENRLHSALCPA